MVEVEPLQVYKAELRARQPVIKAKSRAEDAETSSSTPTATPIKPKKSSKAPRSHFSEGGLVRILKFVYKGEPNDPKMLRWTHPILSTVLAYIGTFVVLSIAERIALSPTSFFNPIGPNACPSSMFSTLDECKAARHWRYGGAAGLSDEATATFRTRLGVSLLGYFCAILGPRIWMLGPQNVYECLWGCNISLVFMALALFLNKPLWSNGVAFALAIDQITWWMDVISFIWKRKFVIGVARYLTWPECHWYKKVTCGHHLWFWPLICYCLWAYAPQTGNSFPWLATIWMGWAVEFCLIAFPRILLPAYGLWPVESSKAFSQEDLAKAPRDEYGHPLVMQYLNVNLSYAGWKDIKLAPSIFNASWIEGSWWFQYLPYQNFVWACCNIILSLPFLLFL